MQQQNLQIVTTHSDNRFSGYQASEVNKNEQDSIIALALELLAIRNQHCSGQVILATE